MIEWIASFKRLWNALASRVRGFSSGRERLRRARQLGREWARDAASLERDWHAGSVGSVRWLVGVRRETEDTSHDVYLEPTPDRLHGFAVLLGIAQRASLEARLSKAGERSVHYVVGMAPTHLMEADPHDHRHRQQHDR